MADEQQASLATVPSSLALVPSHNLGDSPRRERRGMFGRLARLWRREDGEAAPGLQQLSITTLQAELLTIDQGISAAMQALAALETGEQEALARRDKVALDVAWQGRESETAKVEELGHKREFIYKALLDRFIPEVGAWSRRCEVAVDRWQTEDRQQVDRIEHILREMEGLVWNLSTRDTRRAAEREKLLDEFEALSQKAGAIPLTRPVIDWGVPPVSLRDVSVRVQSVQELLQGRENELGVSAG